MERLDANWLKGSQVDFCSALSTPHVDTLQITLHMQSIGDRIQGLLHEKRVTKTELARAIGVSLNTVSRWTTPTVSKRTTPSDRDLQDVAGYLGTDLEYLKTGTGNHLHPPISVTNGVRIDMVQVVVGPEGVEVDTVYSGAGYINKGAFRTVYSDDITHLYLYIAASICMSPIIDPGDRVIIEPREDILSGCVYLIHHPDTGVMMGIAYPRCEEVLLKCSGDKQELGFVVSKEGLTVIGRVLRVIKIV